MAVELNPLEAYLKATLSLSQVVKLVSLVQQLVSVARLIRPALMPHLILLQVDYLALKTQCPQNNQVAQQACLELMLPRAPAVEDLEWVVELKIHRSPQALALPVQSLVPQLPIIRPAVFLVKQNPQNPLLSNLIQSLTCRLDRPSKTTQEVNRIPKVASSADQMPPHRSQRSVGLRRNRLDRSNFLRLRRKTPRVHLRPNLSSSRRRIPLRSRMAKAQTSMPMRRESMSRSGGMNFATKRLRRSATTGRDSLPKTSTNLTTRLNYCKSMSST